MEHSIDAVSNNLKSIRQKRNLSLDQLSELTGVSKSMLRQIETGKSSPTISTIWKIANGLKLSFTALLKSPEIEAIVGDFKHEKSLTAKSGHYRLFPLIPFDPRRSFETYYLEIDPKTDYSAQPHEGEVEEYVFVLSGKLEMTIKDKAHTVNQDQFIRFKADCHHNYKCVGKKIAKTMIVISYLS